jgi:hypothetical protein
MISIWCVGQQKADTVTLDDYYVDFAIPDLSAFNLLGLKEKDAIVRPGSVKEFAASLSNIVGPNGELTPATAVEYAPLMSLLKNNPDLWKSTIKWQNFVLSLGTNRIDTLGTRFAFGFKYVLIDESDPAGNKDFQDRIGELLRGFGRTSAKTYGDYTQSVNQLLIQSYPDNAPNGPENRLAIANVIDIANEKMKRDLRHFYVSENFGSMRTYLLDSLSKIDAYKNLTEGAKKELDPFITAFVLEVIDQKSANDFVKQKIKALKEDFKKRNWNAPAWQIGGGWVTNSPTGDFDDLGKEKFSLFTAFALPLSAKNSKKKACKWLARHSQATIQLQYSNDYSALTKESDRFSTGARLLFGDASNRLSLEGMYVKSGYDEIQPDTNSKTDTWFRWSVGGEFKLAQGSWLEIAIGGLKTIDGKASNEILPRFGLKHALQNKRRYDLN